MNPGGDLGYMVPSDEGLLNTSPYMRLSNYTPNCAYELRGNENFHNDFIDTQYGEINV